MWEDPIGIIIPVILYGGGFYLIWKTINYIIYKNYPTRRHELKKRE